METSNDVADESPVEANEENDLTITTIDDNDDDTPLEEKEYEKENSENEMKQEN